jgi:hypothetical protein
MKKNNRITIIIAALLVVIAGVLIWNNRYLSTLQGEASDFQVWDTASVTKIYLADRRENESLLERQEDGWTLNGIYKAHPKQVNYLLTTLYKIRIKMPVSVASHDNIVKQLASQSTKVEIYQMVPRINLFDRIKLFYHEKRTKVFYVGDATMDNSGTFMLKEGADKAYIVYIPSFRGFISTRFTANPDDWRDHTIFHEKLADIQSVEIDFNEDPEGSFRIDNIGRHQYKLTRLCDNKDLPYDTLKVINFLTSFSDLRFEALFTNTMEQERIDSITSSPFVHNVVLTSKNGSTQDMKTFKKLVLNGVTDMSGDYGDVDHDRMYALIDGGKDFVLIQNYVFDKVLHDVRYFEAGNPIRGDMGYLEEIK